MRAFKALPGAAIVCVAVALTLAVASGASASTPRRECSLDGTTGKTTCAFVSIGAEQTFAVPAGAAAATWMSGPGCGGRVEWRQHPVAFPYFCDGAALVEHVRWSNWGDASAIARATMNEADLRHGASVGTAPRIHSAITLTATHIETCSGRRTYTAISIRFDKRHIGPSTLQYPAYLPHCSAGSPPSGSSPRLWSALAGKVECGPTAPTLAELLCNSSVIPPPPTGEGDAGFVFLQATGTPMVARVGQLLWPENGPFAPLAAGATWSDKALQITCNVGANDVRCSNGSGNGFTISQTSYAPF